METLQGFTLLLMLLTVGHVDTYKPVIYVHGIIDGSELFMPTAEFIRKVHPGTKVVPTDIFTGIASFAPMWKQVHSFRRIIKRQMLRYPDGIHLICYSQGTLICRAVLSTLPHHNVHTFIALAGPLTGLYGELRFKGLQILPEALVTNGHLICYNKIGQKQSVCNYWNDPFHRSSYLRGNSFLPVLNGEIPHKNRKVWRKNFLRIKKLVLIGGPNDDLIVPWQSSFFGSFDSNNNIIKMRDQQFYKDDAFGLRTLDKHKKIFVCNRAGVTHELWLSNFTVFEDCMKKFLT